MVSVSVFLSSFFEVTTHFIMLQLLSKESSKVKFKELKASHDETINRIIKAKQLNPSTSEGYNWLIRKYEIARDGTYLDFLEFQNQHYILFLYAQVERYFFQCFKHIMMIRYPDILKENTVSIGTILGRNKNFDVIIEEKVENIIIKLFYSDYKEVLKFAEKKLGIIHDFSEDDILELNKIRALRNLFAHGDGTVTWIYLDKVKDTKLKRGDKVTLTEEIKLNLERKINQLLIKFDQIFLKAYPNMDFLKHLNLKN